MSSLLGSSTHGQAARAITKWRSVLFFPPRRRLKLMYNHLGAPAKMCSVEADDEIWTAILTPRIGGCSGETFSGGGGGTK